MQARNLKLKGLLLTSLYLVLVLAEGCGERQAGIMNKKKEAASKNQFSSKESKLSALLYRLVASDKREAFAKEHDIYVTGERVRVFVILEPGTPQQRKEKLVKDHHLFIEKKTGDLLRVLAPIDGLMRLSQEPVVRAVNLPDKPYLLKTEDEMP